MRIVVLDGYTLNPGDNPWSGVEKLGELVVQDRTPPEQVVERARGAGVLLTNKTPITAEHIRDLPDLKFISVLATGFNIVDIAAARQRGIPVSNIPEYGTDSVAQFTFALLLELCHHVGLHDAAVKAGEWSSNADWTFWRTPLVELAGRTMGIVGYGRIGRRVGEIAQAFGMRVMPADLDDPVEPVFSKADVVSLHCPLTPQNQGMVNSRLLERMQPHAMLINTSRGPLVVDQDLADALNAGSLAGAALDVVSTEPIRPDNPLLKARNCLLTPHIAWATLSARRRLMQTTAGNIAAFQAGRPMNVVN
jgi:glycerate dehydrogenase